MQRVMSGLAMLRRFGQTLGPYLMLEILLPGGTLLALLLFLYRRRQFDIESILSRALAAMTRDLASMVGEGIFALRPCYLPPWQAFHPPAGDRSRLVGELNACRASVSQCGIWTPSYDSASAAASNGQACGNEETCPMTRRPGPSTSLRACPELREGMNSGRGPIGVFNRGSRPPASAGAGCAGMTGTCIRSDRETVSKAFHHDQE